MLKRDWQPTLGLRHVLMVIRCLLIGRWVVGWVG